MGEMLLYDESNVTTSMVKTSSECLSNINKLCICVKVIKTNKQTSERQEFRFLHYLMYGPLFIGHISLVKLYMPFFDFTLIIYIYEVHFNYHCGVLLAHTGK